MADLVIAGGTVITMDPARQVIPNGAVAVGQGRILAVGPLADVVAMHGHGNPVVIDARGKAVLPGLIDGHSHAGHGLVKTLANGDGAMWMEACGLIYTRASPPSFWFAEAMLASLERLMFGVTTAVSLLGGGDSVMRVDDPAYCDAHCAAVSAIGLREIVALGPTRPPHPRVYTGADGAERPVSFEQQYESIAASIARWHGRAGIRMATLMPVYRKEAHDPAELALIERQGRAMLDLALRHGCLFHQDGHRAGSIAMAERYFGLCGPRSFFSHCTDLTEADIETLARTGTAVVHNPTALAAVRGYCPAPALMEKGVRVILGSDATAPDRSSDMFRHMVQAMRLHQRHYRDERLLPPGKLLEMCTIDAAHVLGMGHEVGSLEVGKFADIITVDLSAPHMAPANMPVSRLVMFASGADVRDVVVGGQVKLRERVPQGIDTRAVVAQAEAEAAAMLARSGLGPLAVEQPGWGRVRRG